MNNLHNLIEKFGQPDALIDHWDETSRRYAIWEFDEEFLPDVSGNTSGRILKILCYRDPSTKKTYISFVPGEINKADTAMAWKFHLTRAEYDTLHVEA